MDLIQLNLQCVSYYTVKIISLYKNLETKYYLQVVVSPMRQLLQKVLDWWILFSLSIKRGFGKYLVVWTILRKNDN